MDKDVIQGTAEDVGVTSFEPQVNGEAQIVPLSAESLSHFTPEQQKAITDIAAQIDVLQIERIMSYGQIPLLRTFEEAGKILKAKQGTEADQEVIKQVMELSKLANESYEDFNLVLQKPNLLQRAILSISKSARSKRDKDIKIKAITNYKLLESLRNSCEQWIKMLVESYSQITDSAYGDRASCIELEQYIVAGYIAMDRIEAEVAATKAEYDVSGLQEAKHKWDSLREGLETFRVVMLNLEKSRAAMNISVGQLILMEKANRNIQIAVRTQKANSMALASQQLRNAVLDAENRIVLEGQRAIAKLNDELLKKVATNAVITAEESEKILLSGIYTVEAGLEAAKTVIEGCRAIEKSRVDRYAEISQEMSKLKVLLEDLAPVVGDLKESSTDEKNSGTNSTASNGTLVF